MPAQIVPERLAKLDSIVLLYGNHDSPEAGMCAMEAAAWIAGEEHTDHPSCVCPVIAAILRTANDRMGSGPEADERRTRVIRPLLPLIIGSRYGREEERRRTWMSSDWAIRSAVPRLLRLTSLAE